MDPDQVVEVFETATEENYLDSRRQHQVVHLGSEGELWAAGDFHDHRRNFNKFISGADLSNNPGRILLFQELLHGEHLDPNGCEDSWRTLYRAAELKCDHPQQVHFILANHDLAQIHGEGIAKAGVNVCRAFTNALKRDFGDHYPRVDTAITEFLLSFPLAIRCPNGLFISHSAPTDPQLAKFDYTVFNRALTGKDYARRTGPAYQLLWGRCTSPDGMKAFADNLGATIVITGHQPKETGFTVNGNHHLIITSDHNHGVFVRIDLAQTYVMSGLVSQIMKFTAME